MENGKIPDSQIAASSHWDDKVDPTRARLNINETEKSYVNQWIHVDFKNKAIVTNILTQGRNDNGQWIKSYTVYYSNDGIDFTPYQKGGEVKVI